MEIEFLNMGDNLAQLSEQLSGMHTECRSLTELTLGKVQDSAVGFAFQLLKKAEDFVLAGYEQYDHVFAAFSELQQRLAQLSKLRDELMRILLPLNCTTISFRIEATRHPVEIRQSFHTLADTVSETVTKVRSTMEKQFDELAASERMAKILMDRIFKSIQNHRQQVSSTLELSWL